MKRLSWKKAIFNLSALILAFMLLATAQAVTIPERISFRDILENKEVPLGEVHVFHQDSQGFIWLGGSNSLVRYDGYEFKPLELTLTDGRRTDTIHVSAVNDIFEDPNKTLWIAARQGLLLFDPIKEVLTRVPDDELQPAKISVGAINKILQLPDQKILACSLAGLFVIDPSTKKYTVILPDASRADGLKSQRINSAYLDGQNNVWLGTDEGLEKWEFKNNAFTLYKPDPENPESVANNRVADIAADRNGTFWLATANGLVNYDIQIYKGLRYKHSATDKFSLGGNDIWKLLVDSQGILWVATDDGGLAVFDRENNRFINNQHESGRAGSLNTNQVRTVFEDNSGDIWVGNYPVGVNFFDRASSAILSYSRDPSDPKSLNHNTVQSVLEDDKGQIWLGTDGGGFNVFNRKSEEFTSYKSIAEDATTLNGNAIITHIQDSTGLMWVGVWGGGIASFNPADTKFTRYPFDLQRKMTEPISTSSRLNSPHVWSIREDSRGAIWISTHTGGLSKYDKNTKLFTHYANAGDNPNSLPYNLVWTTFEDSKGNFWVGTNVGLSLMDRESGTFTNYLVNSKVPNGLSNSSAHVIFEDSKHRLWIGTDAGLNRFNTESKNFTVYNKANGFADDTIRQILEDTKGILWVSTNKGFSSFNPETEVINNFTRISGRLIGSFSTQSGTRSRNGEIIFGGVNGLRIIKPQDLTENTKAPPIVLTDFRIFSDSVAVDGADGILTRSINMTDTITLDHTRSMIAFGFSALNYRDTEKNRYAYKLEGFDTEWIDARDQRVAKYTNLSPGNYVFRVKGSNNDGIWNESGKSISIIQLSPPWKTWWAYLIYAMILCSIMVALFNQQRRKRQFIEEQNRILEIRVAERTAEVTARTAEVTARTAEVLEKSKDIQIMLSHIPQGLFTVKSDGRIHSEYSQHLETIFETQNIAERTVMDLLFTGAKIPEEEMQLARVAIFAIIGEDELNFTLNSGLLAREYAIEIHGKMKFLSLDWNPIVDSGVVNRLMVSVRDISHVKHMETNLIQSEKLAALGALVAGVAHELNTPIGNGLTVATSLCESVNSIKQQVKTGLTKSALDKFIGDMDEGSNLVNRNLSKASELVSTFKQVAVDRTSAQRRKFSLKEIVNEVCLTISPSFKRTPYVVEVEIPTDITLDSYPGPLGQVITNLLTNALIHAFDQCERGRVLIRTQNVVGGVAISVIDDGLGIAAENQTKIFDPFFTTKLGAGGNGLGMHIVHNIVTGVLGGNITVASAVGKGTTFTIVLPRSAPAEQDNTEYHL